MWYEQVYSGVITLFFLQCALYISGPFNKIDTGYWRRREVNLFFNLKFLMFKCL